VAALRALLEGIAGHSGKGLESDYEWFRANIQTVLDRIAQQNGEGIQSQVLTVVTALREYNHRMGRYRQQQMGELRNTVEVLVKTLEDLAVASPEKTRHLQELGDRLRSLEDVEELRQANREISECLGAIRVEAMRHPGEVGADATKDPITNLENRSVAETALVEACSSQEVQCPVIIRVERLATYNLRYGRHVGDRVMRFVAEHLHRIITEGVYRWTGPGLLAIRRGAQQKVQAEMRYIDSRLHCEIDTGSRTVLLPIELRWCVFPLVVDPRMLINKIDAFMTSTRGR